MTWGVIEDYRAEAVEVIRETEQMVFYKSVWGSRVRERRAYREKFAATGLSSEAAGKLAERINSASAEMERRLKATRAWFSIEREKLIASVDRSPEGQDPQGLGAQHESAVRDSADAQTPSEAA